MNVGMVAFIGTLSFAQASGFERLNYTLHQSRVSPAPVGMSYDKMLADHNGTESRKWYHFADSACSELRAEPTKMHALSLFTGVFMPEVPKSQIGYIDSKNQLREFSVQSVEHQQLESQAVLALESNSVVIVPVSWDSAQGKMNVYVHYHNEPKAPWGFDQDFSSFPGGRVEKGVHVLSAALNEFYEEMGFQVLPEAMILHGYRHTDKNITYVYIEVPQGSFKDIAINAELPTVAQFFPFDRAFFLSPEDEAAHKAAIAELKAKAAEGTLKAGTKEYWAEEGKIDSKFKKKAAFPRQRGDYDSNGVWAAEFLPSVQPGTVFLAVNKDGHLGSVLAGKPEKTQKAILEGRFGSYANPDTFADLTEIYHSFRK